MPSRDRTVAIIGAECSGKSWLAGALGRELPAVVVPEYLRTFVAEHGRVPALAEQHGLLGQQIEQERLALASTQGWVVSDAGVLTTAAYSVLYFGDETLIRAAVAHHRTAYRATLWCGIDIPWIADPGQRDGAAYRRRGHQIIAEIIADAGLDFVPVTGPAQQRLAAALAVLLPRSEPGLPTG